MSNYVEVVVVDPALWKIRAVQLEIKQAIRSSNLECNLYFHYKETWFEKLFRQPKKGCRITDPYNPLINKGICVIGAGNEVRTRDPNLGKVTMYITL